MKIYTYKNCGTCRKATKWLTNHGIAYEEVAIREQPPSKKELDSMLKAYDGDLRKLFNTSGLDYRSLGLKDKLPTMSKQEALTLLTQNGNLVKRPFVLTDSFKAVGFKEGDWVEGLS